MNDVNSLNGTNCELSQTFSLSESCLHHLNTFYIWLDCVLYSKRQNIMWNKSPVAKLICFIFIETFYSNFIFLKEKMAIFMFVYLKSFNKTQMDIIFWSGCCVKSLLSTVVQILLLFSWGINSFLSMLCLWAVLSVRADVVDNQSDKSQKWVWKCRSNCQARAEWQFPSHCPHPSHDQSLTAKKKCVIM